MKTIIIAAALCAAPFLPAAMLADDVHTDSVKIKEALRGERQVNLPLFQTKYTADPSPLVIGDTLFLYTSHDASPEDIPHATEPNTAGRVLHD